MNTAALAARHSRAVILVSLALFAAGAIAAFKLPSAIYPRLRFPRILVIAHSGTLPAETMILNVTRPLEQALMEVQGIRRVRSTTFRGATEVSAQFEPSADMLVALQQAEGRIAEVRAELPAGTELAVEQLTLSAFPVLSLNLTGKLSIPDLYDYAFYVMRPALARVPGVGRVEVLSSDTREIEVVCDPARLLAADLTVADVAAALKATNRVDPIGRYVAQGRQYLVLASALWQSVDDVARTPVVVRGAATVRVGDVATVFPGTPDRTSLVTGNGTDAAVISLSQQVDTNILAVKAGVETALVELAKSLPSGLRISKVYDLAAFVSEAIANVRDAIVIGGVLAVLVLLLFLRNLRMTLIAAVTLPLTAISTFLFMHLLDASINVMSMGGLAVAIGLVIDDAVVVVENIHRKLGEGAGDEAADRAMSELFAPLVSSTLTTVVVFAPLSLLTGVVGQFFRALSLTLSVSVLLSLVLALTLIPLLAKLAFSGHAAERRKAAAPLGAIDRAYARALEPALARPALSLAALAVLAVGGWLLYHQVGTGFLPHADEGGFVIDYLSPAGTALAETDQVVRKIEKLVHETPEVASFSRRTGSELGLFATQQNKGDILVRLKPRSARDRSADEVIADLRPRIHEIAPALDVEFVQLLQDMIGDLEGSPEPIEVKVFGDDPAVLEELAGQVEERMEKVKGVVDVVGVQHGNPEVTWEIDPVAAGRIGLTVEQVGSQLSSAWLGETATDLRLFDRHIPVRVRYPDRDRYDPERLAAITLRGAEGKRVPISTVARRVAANGQSVLLRENLRSMALVSSRLEGRDLGGGVTDIRKELASLKLPVGYTWEIGGQYESQQQAFSELLLVFAIAAALVFVILVVQFRAFVPAILILAAAPLSLGGAFALLLVTGTELNISSAMGLILLVGLVVKNGIVMLDYAHRLEEEGKPLREAIAQAAQVRLRPILMTTLCTLFGLFPLALGLGAGAELQKPLALAVIGGLTLSTLVTLFVVPTLYVELRRGR